MSQGEASVSAGKALQQEMKCVWSTKLGASVDRILASAQGVAAVVNQTSIFIVDCTGPINVKQELKGHSAGITAATFSAKGTEIIAGGKDGFLKWWQVDNGEETCSTQFPYYHGDDQTEPVINGVGPLAISAVACSKGLNLVAAASGRFVCIFGPGGEHLHTITSHPEAISQLVWSTDSRLAVACGSKIHTWTVSASQYHKGPVYASKPTGLITCLSSSPDGKYIAAACETSTIQVFQAVKDAENSSGPAVTFPVHVLSGFSNSEIRCLSWDASSRFLATALGSDVLVWDLHDVNGSNKANMVCVGHERGHAVTSISFQQAGPLMVTAADNGKLLVYDAATFAAKGAVACVVYPVTTAQVQELPGPSDVSVTWHSAGFAVAATQAGNVGFFQTTALEVQRLATGIEEMFQVRHDGQPTRRRNFKQPAGWGGEPLLTIEPQADQQTAGFGSRNKNRQSTPPNGMAPTITRKGMRPTRAKPVSTTSAGPSPQGMQPFRRESSTTPQPTIEQQPQVVPGWGMMPQMGGMRWPAMHHMPYMPYAQGMPGQIPAMPGAPVQGMPPYMQAPMPASPAAVQGMGPRPPPGPPMQMPMPVAYMYQPNPAQWPMGYMQQWPYFTYYPFQQQAGQVQSPQHSPHHPQGMPTPMPGQTPGMPSSTHPPLPPPQPGFHGHSDERHGPTLTRRSSTSSVDKEASTSARAAASEVSETSSANAEDPRAKAIQTLYVGNLSPEVDEHALYSLFIQYGYIASVQVIRDKSTNHSRGFGFVTYIHPASASMAMHHMNGLTPPHPAFQGRTVKVSPSNRC